jgi:uncharacterized DUF497 family protein
VQYNFEWDPNKSKLNLRKHKISFERSTQIFLDPLAVSIFDTDHSENEDRWITLGKDRNEVLLIVIHTFLQNANNQCRIRIISARKATKNEIKQYHQGHLR